ncbi:MAG: histone acethyltransferase [Parcubacteria group bacterium LiPW_39]|nr:MAG: histone acethyltransferase [Parcubacteria group bacterium LiPW_39]
MGQIIKKGDFSPSFLAVLKRRAAKKYQTQFFTNAELIKVYHKLLANGKLSRNERLEKLLRRRAIRTLSGVAVVTVLTSPRPWGRGKPSSCPGRCLYCPDEKGMPKSYLKNEPAASRAFLTNFDPMTQVKTRIKALAMNGHATDKIELIILGGTWSAYPKNYQYWFVKECFRAANAANSKINPVLNTGQKSKIFRFHRESSTKSGQFKIQNLLKLLKQEQRKNETAKHRIVGLTLETRPDYINLEEIKKMRDLGGTRVELGVQSIYDDVLKKNRRGHKIADTIRATRLLKDAGFKINYHLMLNLPGSNPRRDFKMFKKLFSDSNFQPDLLKIYPCLVLATAPLYKIWKRGGYQPYTEKQLTNLLLKIKKIIPPYVRIQRIVRDIPKESIMAGCKVSNLRQIIDNSGKKICRCIRCREIRGQYSSSDKIKLFRRDYEASGGKEIFLSFEDPKQKKLYALLRLRIPKIPPNLPFKKGGKLPPLKKEGWGGFYKNSETPTVSDYIPVLRHAALIRELHTYGSLVPIDKKEKQKAQHTGLGKKLMAQAERIAKEEFGLNKIAVISGVGVRRYYRNLNYGLKDEYMVKVI